MRTGPALATVAALVAITTAIVWQASTPPPPDTGGPAAPLEATNAAPVPAVVDTDAGMSTPESGGIAASRDRTAPPHALPAGTEPRDHATTWNAVVWPVRRGTPPVAPIAATAEPSVPVKLAFRALWYLGTDPDAERTWSRAINDLDHPPGVRSDLIVDMVDEGYTDNDHPGPADLPVIAARLDILERHAPYAIDEANRKAFEKAYQSLLELYLRLGGAPRNPR